jgi:hypothetical protein
MHAGFFDDRKGFPTRLQGMGDRIAKFINCGGPYASKSIDTGRWLLA